MDLDTSDPIKYLVSGLVYIEANYQPRNGDFSNPLYQAFQQISIVKQVLQDVQTVLQQSGYTPQQVDAWWESIDQTTQTLCRLFEQRNGDEVKSLMLDIMRHTLSSARALNVQNDHLEEAIQTLETGNLPPNTFSLRYGNQFNSTGGRQFNNTGSGKQSNNTGSGTQNIADNMYTGPQSPERRRRY